MAKKGFTLIELLIVVALTGMLAAFTIPQLSKFQKRSVVRKEAADVESMLKLAQSMARSGVQDQNGGAKIDYYKFSLSSNGAAGCYNGYYMQGYDDTDTLVGVKLGETDVQCPIVIESSWDSVDFQTITGRVINNSWVDSTSLKVCYPGLGHIPITIYRDGHVTRGDFIDTPCTCSCNP